MYQRNFNENYPEFKKILKNGLKNIDQILRLPIEGGGPGKKIIIVGYCGIRDKGNSDRFGKCSKMRKC